MLLALPLMANRLVLNGLQSIEAVYIPNRLMLYGLSTADSLRCYGVLTGMVLPLLFISKCHYLLRLCAPAATFPKPKPSEIIERSVRRSKNACLPVCCSAVSVVCFCSSSVPFSENCFFNSTLAGDYIRMLSIVCPILYMGSVLNSILHGLGRALSAFLYNVVSLLLRLAFVFLPDPVHWYVRLSARYLFQPALVYGPDSFLSSALFS